MPSLAVRLTDREQTPVITVLSVGYPLAPVNPDSAGGAEQILASLDRALVARGHRSVVIACEGSRTAGHLLSFPRIPVFDADSRQAVYREVRRKIREALQRWDIDLVHMHGVDFYEYLPPVGVPVLVTLHLPVSFYPASVFRFSRPETYLNCVSAHQFRTCPSCKNMLEPIENGIPLNGFPQTPGVDLGYALALGRICPEKGFHLALEAAERSGVPLWVAGPVFPYPEHERYFRERLLPRLVSPHRYLGPVGFDQKIRLLSGARCVLIASQVPETSSLVAMEAQACGTPVIGFPSGAVGGLVENGQTGFLVSDVAEMSGAIAAAGAIDRTACRRRARRLFSEDRMANQYLDAYLQIVRSQTVAATR